MSSYHSFRKFHRSQTNTKSLWQSAMGHQRSAGRTFAILSTLLRADSPAFCAAYLRRMLTLLTRRRSLTQSPRTKARTSRAFLVFTAIQTVISENAVTLLRSRLGSRHPLQACDRFHRPRLRRPRRPLAAAASPTAPLAGIMRRRLRPHLHKATAAVPRRTDSTARMGSTSSMPSALRE